jgi:hypothetical protein
MHNTVNDVDAYAFWNLKNTKNVMVSSGVSTIPKYSMAYMGTVENVIIQNTTTKIEGNAFTDNTQLKQVAIPASVTDIDKKAFNKSEGFKIYTSKSSTADKFGTDNNIEVIYKSEYPTDFMDSNPGLEEKPEVGTSTVSDNTTVNSSTTVNNTTVDSSTVVGNQTQTEDETETESESNTDNGGTGRYIHPLDVPEDDSVIGKTVIVAGKAVILSNNHDEKVYDGE